MFSELHKQRKSNFIINIEIAFLGYLIARVIVVVMVIVVVIAIVIIILIIIIIARVRQIVIVIVTMMCAHSSLFPKRKLRSCT